MRIAFYTLGCKVNQYETQALEQIVTARGHLLVPFEGEADAYIINTCTVTAVSDKKSRQVIRRARKRAPDAVIAVCGCYPQTHPAELEGLSIDLVSGHRGPGRLRGPAGADLAGAPAHHRPGRRAERRAFEVLPPAGWRAAPGPC